MKAQLDVERMQNKMNRMKVEFQLTKKNMKKVCCDFAIDYFKSKSTELTRLFTNECLKLLMQYQVIRQDSIEKDTKIKEAIAIIQRQEVMITDLRHFIEEHLTPILKVVEREQTNLRLKYKKEYGRPMPHSVASDPFAIFALYSSMIHQHPGGLQINRL